MLRELSPHPEVQQMQHCILPAIANEAGIKFDLFDVAEIFKSTPYIADLKPGGSFVAKDLYEVGGFQYYLKRY